MSAETQTAPAFEIGTDVESGDRLDLPVEDVLTGRGVLFGQSGAGKSNSASVVIEQLLERGHAVLIVDTDGEYYGLKEKYDVLHATGDDTGDIQVGPEHADHLADLALDQNVPVILDVSAFLDPDDADELVGKVARALFTRAKKLRKPFLLVVEEAHEYVPQTGGAGFAGEHITRIAKRGRKHGLGFLGISQRPANVDKDVVTQCNWLVWHRLKWENDVGRASEMYGSDIAERIRALEDGEAYFDANWHESAHWTRWDRKGTFDAGETPGLDETERPELRSIDEEVLEELREAGGAAKSREERIEQLEDQLADREARIDELESEKERLEERNAWEEQMAERAFEGLGGELDVELGEGSIRADVLEIIEERDELDEEADQLQAALDEAREDVDRLEAEVDRLEDELAEAEQHEELEQLREDLRELTIERYPDLLGVETDERVDELRRDLGRARDRIEDLEQRRPDEVVLETELLANDVVREHIDAVAEASRYNADRVWDVVVALSGLAEGKFARSREVSKQVDISESSVSDILRDLEGRKVAKARKNPDDGRWKEYALDREALQDLVSVTDQQQAIEEQRERIRSEASTAEPAEPAAPQEDSTPEPEPEPEPLTVQDELLAEFQDEAIDRVMANVADLSSRQKRMVKYIESRGRTLSSQKAWAQRALGLAADPSGTHYEEMGEVIDAGFVVKNEDGSIKPNVRGLVEAELDGYDVDAATVQETYERVLERVAAE